MAAPDTAAADARPLRPASGSAVRGVEVFVVCAPVVVVLGGDGELGAGVGLPGSLSVDGSGAVSVDGLLPVFGVKSPRPSPGLPMTLAT